MEEATHTSRAALRPGTAAVVKRISRPGLRDSEPARVCQFHAADNGVSTRVVHPQALSASHPDAVAESSLNIGNESCGVRARVQVVMPLWET